MSAIRNDRTDELADRALALVVASSLRRHGSDPVFRRISRHHEEAIPNSQASQLGRYTS
jgi:hypothetical protein